MPPNRCTRRHQQLVAACGSCPLFRRGWHGSGDGAGRSPRARAVVSMRSQRARMMSCCGASSPGMLPGAVAARMVRSAVLLLQRRAAGLLQLAAQLLQVVIQPWPHGRVLLGERAHRIRRAPAGSPHAGAQRVCGVLLGLLSQPKNRHPACAECLFRLVGRERFELSTN